MSNELLTLYPASFSSQILILSKWHPKGLDALSNMLAYFGKPKKEKKPFFKHIGKEVFPNKPKDALVTTIGASVQVLIVLG